ncbi:hypothetical protein LIER_07628 [Lithospermum erythrorhizon]|uniref:MULE transposase domain-containing protein n=1 Tax=Lithospermum erythrorhizon TaxID=34254 RepID=A0AAV3PA78_LITER
MDTNPRTSCYVKTVDNAEGKSSFQRWYLCFTACREAFKSGCRKIVGVDGCHLNTKRGGQLLVAVGIDPNNNIFSIAYGLVEIENKESWEWFLKHLCEDIVDSETVEGQDNEWTCMSDKHQQQFNINNSSIEAFKTVLLRVDHRSKAVDQGLFHHCCQV